MLVCLWVVFWWDFLCCFVPNVLYHGEFIRFTLPAANTFTSLFSFSTFHFARDTTTALADSAQNIAKSVSVVAVAPPSEWGLRRHLVGEIENCNHNIGKTNCQGFPMEIPIKTNWHMCWDKFCQRNSHHYCLFPTKGIKKTKPARTGVDEDELLKALEHFKVTF